jgi:hypothetical protein
MIMHYIKHILRNIKEFFNPRQKWLLKKIPNSWCDKTELIKIVAFESIVHFVEEEKAFTKIEWNSTEHHIEAAKNIKRAYFHIKNMKELEKIQDQAWANPLIKNYFKSTTFTTPVTKNINGLNITQYIISTPNEETIVAINYALSIDKKIEDIAQDVVEITAKYRHYLWT